MSHLLDIIVNLQGPIGYLLVFLILLACGLGLPIPEDITLIAAGYYAHLGNSNVYIMIVVSLAGVLIGDSFVFLMGQKYGLKLINRWPFDKFLTEERIDTVRKMIHRHGNKVIFSARFMPGFRAPIFFTAGSLHLHYYVFLFYDGLAALISVPTIVYVIYVFGEHLETVTKKIKTVQGGVMSLIVVVVIFFAVKYFLKHRRRKKDAENEIKALHR